MHCPAPVPPPSGGGDVHVRAALWHMHAGADELGEGATHEQNKVRCLHRCIAHDACGTALFNYRTHDCRILVRDSGAQRHNAPDWEILELCEADDATGGYTAVCKCC